MTLARIEDNKRIWKCDICGKEDFWDENWSWYGSYAHVETCPDDIPTVCSDKCMNELLYKIKHNFIKLPFLKNQGYYMEVRGERKGY